MSFYLILFVSLAVMALTHPANQANTPAFTANLRHIVMPLSVAAGVIVFVMSFRRSSRWNQQAGNKGENKKVAA